MCDQLASEIAAEIVTHQPALVTRLVRLAGSRHRWTRRFAVATAADLSHAGRGQTGAAFAVCGKLLGDEDAMIQTAIGWAIREASKADAAAAFAFLKRSKPKLLPRTLRDAAARLTAARRKELLG